MGEGEPPGVQHEACVRMAVYPVAHDGMARVTEMYTDLVRASGVRHHENQAFIGVACEDVKRGCRIPPLRLNTHSGGICRIAADGSIDVAFFFCEVPFDEGEIGLFDFAGGEVTLKERKRLRCLCDNDSAARFFIKPVDDSGPSRCTPRGKVSIEEKGFYQRWGMISGPWVNHQAGRFVDHDNLIVFVQDGKI